MNLFQSFIDLIDLDLHWPIRMRINPLFAAFSSTFSGDYGSLPGNYLIFCKLWFVLSCVLLGALSFRKLAPVAGVLLLSGFATLTIQNEAVWGLCHAFPTALLFIKLAEKRAAVAQLVCALVAISLWSFIAGPFAFVGLLVFLPQLSKLEPVAFASSLFLGAIESIMFLPVYEMPSYPDNARIALISPATFWGAPLVGPEIAPNPLNYEIFQNQLSDLRSVSVLLMLSTAVMFGLAFLVRKTRPTRTELTLFAFTFLVALWSFIERRSGASLTLTLSKMIYGMALAPIPFWIFFFAILCTISFLSAQKEFSSQSVLALLVGLVFVLLRLPCVVPPASFAGKEHARFFSDEVRSFFDEAGARIASVHLQPFSRLKDANAVSSISPANAHLAVDGDIHTRWSTGVPQNGGEAIEVQFPTPQSCDALHLALGAWPNDFPRGLAVDAKTPLNPDVFSPLVQFANWQGALRVTKDRFFYFGSQNVVELALPEIPNLTSLRIRQTGRDSFYFWSIAEIECLTSSK